VAFLSKFFNVSNNFVMNKMTYICCFIWLFACLTTVPPSFANNYPNENRGGENGRNYRNGNSITYEWSYKDGFGTERSFSMYLSLGWDWDYVQRVYAHMNHRHGNYHNFIKKDPFKSLIVDLARELRKLARNSDINECELALAFVQSLPYQENMGAYQRYAIETFIDGRGDCSDTSVLYAGILAAWDYGCIFLLYDTHMAVGLSCTNCDGCYWPWNGRKYFYCETTGIWDMGACIKDISGTNAEYEFVDRRDVYGG
jgi:hypothetical protein